MRLKTHQKGNIDPLLIPLIVSVMFVIGLAVFGILTYTNYQDAKEISDDELQTAIVEANEIQKTTLEAEFAEREKDPKVTFLSDAAIGSIEFRYPKTWSGYIQENKSSSKPLSATFHPRLVPADDTLYALRILVDESSYDSKVTSYENDVEDGTVNSTPITIEGVTGIRFDGQIDNDYKGSLVVFPLRDKTVQIWTESEAYLADFNAIVTQNLTFDP